MAKHIYGLTYQCDDGTWGLTSGYDVSAVPKELYGPIIKLMHYERSGLSPDQLADVDQLFREKCEEVVKLQAKNKELKIMLAGKGKAKSDIDMPHKNGSRLVGSRKKYRKVVR